MTWALSTIAALATGVAVWQWRRARRYQASAVVTVRHLGRVVDDYSEMVTRYQRLWREHERLKRSHPWARDGAGSEVN